MNRLANPFAPGAGAPPPEMAGREKLLEDATIAIERNKLGNHEKPMLISGLRGVGKTVLLNAFRIYSEDQHYGSTFIEAHEEGDFLKSLAQELYSNLTILRRGTLSEIGKRAVAALKSFSLGVGVDGRLTFDVGVNLDDFDYQYANTGDAATDLRRVLVALGEAARERSTVLCIGIDELQYLTKDELRGIISATQAISTRKLPIALFGAGLPNLQRLIADAKTYAERQFHFESVGSLSVEEVHKAVEAPIRRAGASVSDAAIQKIATVTEGYPYFVQEWAHDAWNIARSNRIEEEDVVAAYPVVLERLDRDFFTTRLSRLTARETDYVYALASLGPGTHSTEEVAASFGTSSTACASLRERVIQKGVIFSPRKGETQFTAPLFDDFLIRTQRLSRAASGQSLSKTSRRRS